MASEIVGIDGVNLVLLNAVTATGAGAGVALMPLLGRFGM